MVLISIPIGILGFYFNKFIIKHEKGMYIFSIVIGIVSIIYMDSEHLSLVKDGYLGLALFIVVMYTGGFKRNSKLNKKLRSVRKIYSIMGFILIIPHMAMYLNDIVSGDLEGSKIVILGVLTAVIMLPLTIISFQVIKRKFPIKKWFKYQKYAYIAYFTLFLHLVLINNDNALLYIGVFGIYFGLKLKNYLFLNTKFIWKLTVLVILLGGLYLIGNAKTTTASEDGINVSELTLNDGVYIGTAPSYIDYTVVLEVTILNNEITSILLIDHGSTDPLRKPQYYQAALYIANEIIINNSTELDAIAGATETTEGVLIAVENAIKLAKVN